MAPYLGNLKSNEFHNLANEKAQCQIGEILHKKSFVPDTMAQAIAEGFEPCFFCVGTFAGLGLAPVGFAGAAIASPADLAGEDRGEGTAFLSWSDADDIEAQQITFDLFSSPDPLDPFRTLRAGNLKTTSALLGGFEAGGLYYFTVIARQGGSYSLPSKILPLSIAPVQSPVATPPGGGDSAIPSGLGFPFQIDGGGGVSAQGGDPLLRGKILQLLLTAPGERVNLPEYGTRLRDLVFDPNNDILAATTEFMVNRALQRFLGEALQVDQVTVRNEVSTLQVEIVYVRKADLRMERLRIGLPIP
ncbi:MAG: GPW/gp25 family protein [Nitrospirae bacterium]|nr:GPW/gp25 family protein [Candidatus Manganitrophaceae bacterium]